MKKKVEGRDAKKKRTLGSLVGSSLGLSITLRSLLLAAS